MKRLVTTVTPLVLFGAVSAFPALAQDGSKPPQGQTPAATRDARITELVKKLGDPSFDVREAAQRELIAIGGPALRALDEATRSADPEVASRATEAISRIRGGREVQPERPQVEERDPGMPPDMPPLPDMRDMFKELEGQLPAEFGELLKDLFQGRLPGQDEQGQPEERRPGQPRVRVWNWSSEPRPNVPTPGSFDRVLGAELAPASPALRAQLGISGDEGVVVNQLEPDGRAARAGVQLYDVIVGLDGRSVRSARDLRPLVQGGGKVELYRRAQLQTVDVPGPQQAKPAPAPTPTPPSGNGERSF